MNILRLLLMLMLAGSVTCQNSILPTPTFAEYTGQSLYWFEGDTLLVTPGTFSNGEFEFLQSVYATSGIVLQEDIENYLVYFEKVKKLEKEAYEINSVKNGISIKYSENTGAFYGMLSLLQILHVDKAFGLGVRGVTIKDAPAFSWRGLHLDVSRHFYTVEEVKEFLDIMAIYKFNTFHWHLTDDQGWRIEIKRYPKLTQIGGFRDSTVVGHYNDSPRAYTKERYGGYYTQEDIKEVVAYAQDRHITVVPEIEMPGHSRAALAAYPELSCTGEQQGVPGLWGVFEDIYCSKEESIAFLQNVLEEVLELFPSEYIHIGGDEAPKARWKACPKCAAVMAKNQLENTHELQSYFITRMDAFLTEHGRKLIGWDEILEGGLSPNAAVMSWRGEKGGVEAAEQGHYVVMSPTSYCYFDYYQSSHESEPLAIGGYLPLEKVYEYNPVPSELKEDKAQYILGGQANIWTEYITSMDQVEYMAFPRALALMQGLWCQNKPTYSEFLKTYLTYHEKFLEDLHVNRSESIHIPELKIERAENGVAYSWLGLDSTEFFEIGDSFNGLVGGVYTVAAQEEVIFERGNGFHELMVEFNGDQQLVYTVHLSDVLGAEMKISPEPHNKYNHNGSLNLVDGTKGSIPWKGDQWLGFNESKVEITLAFDSVVKINGFEIGFLNQNGSWIYLPKDFDIWSSADGNQWVKLLEYTLDEDSSAIVRANGFWDLEITAKYVKFEIHPLDEIPEGNGGAGYTPWTFIDEIQIDVE